MQLHLIGHPLTLAPSHILLSDGASAPRLKQLVLFTYMLQPL
jgi:hypothetical protein